jgi:hypothetical protein
LPETLAYFFSFKNGPKKTIAQIGENSPNLVTLLACEVWRRKIISPQKKCSEIDKKSSRGGPVEKEQNLSSNSAQSV